MMTVREILGKALTGQRLRREEGLALLQRAELLDMAEAANTVRFRMNPKPDVTFVIDTNPNYSNICTIDCIFCAFYRHAGEDGEYTYSVDHMISKFKESASNGVTTVLLQGGVHTSLPFEYYLELVERTIREVPQSTRISFRPRKSSGWREYRIYRSGRFSKGFGRPASDRYQAEERKFLQIA